MGIISALFTAFFAHFFLSTTKINAKLVQEGCDIFQGNWVLDNSYPLYDSAQCHFFEKQFHCQKNGRPDKAYMKFDGVDFLKKLKGKRLIFVGDSLSLNQWQSLTCLLHVAVPQANYNQNRIEGLSNFTFPEYNVSLLFYRNAFLVDIVSEPRGRVLKLESMRRTDIWGGMDVMIFDSWHWWLHSGRKQPWDWIDYENTTVKDMDRMDAYTKALNTWAKWIDANVDPIKTQVFFQGVSPDHANGKGCGGQREPLKGPQNPHPAEEVLENVLKGMGKPVHLLNVTALSQERRDAHPGAYGFGGPSFLDCTHWCLSGVPDTWNQLLYARLKLVPN